MERSYASESGQSVYESVFQSVPCFSHVRRATPMLGGVKEVNYFMAFEITLMQRAMIQASYIMLCRVI